MDSAGVWVSRSFSKVISLVSGAYALYGHMGNFKSGSRRGGTSCIRSSVQQFHIRREASCGDGRAWGRVGPVPPAASILMVFLTVCTLQRSRTFGLVALTEVLALGVLAQKGFFFQLSAEGGGSGFFLERGRHPSLPSAKGGRHQQRSDGARGANWSLGVERRRIHSSYQQYCSRGHFTGVGLGDGCWPACACIPWLMRRANLRGCSIYTDCNDSDMMD